MRKHITQKIRNNINQHNKYTISVNIPKIIHQIWIGDNPMPTLWINSVKDFASTYGYKYMLWNNSNIKLLDWKSFEGLTELYNKMTKTGKYEGSGDIIRLLALYKFGGIYIDADSVIVKPEKFNVFLNENKASVFFGWEKFSKDRRIEYNDQQFTVKKLIANGLIGSTVKNAFIQLLLTNLYESFKMNPKKKPWIVFGPFYTYYTYLTYKHTLTDTTIKIYPMKYFYPITWHGIKDPEMHKKMKLPNESMLFQYGYTTNNFKKYFENLQNKTSKNKTSKNKTRKN
jgi:hypothetical protein